MLKRICQATAPLLLIAAAMAAVAMQPHHRRCRLIPAVTDKKDSHLQHVSKNSAPDGFRLVSPSVNCGKCHDPKVHTLIP
jgi:hypothetical protein